MTLFACFLGLIAPLPPLLANVRMMVPGKDYIELPKADQILVNHQARPGPEG